MDHMVDIWILEWIDKISVFTKYTVFAWKKFKKQKKQNMLTLLVL